MHTILIAEDNPDDYFVLEYAFGRAEFIANRVRVQDGKEARAYLAGAGHYSNRVAHPIPALVISDLKMPRMNGLELLRWTRQQPLLKRLPFILLSASGNPTDVSAAYEDFANSYHVKPSRVEEELIELLQYVRAYWFKASVRPEIPGDYLVTALGEGS